MADFFFVVGITLFIGFLATIVFERTKISTVLLLMGFGFLLSQGNIIDNSSDSLIVKISSVVAAISLVILLFDGGMMLDIFRVVKAIPRSTAFTFVVFVFTVTLITLFSKFGLGWPLLHGLLLGAVCGGTSSAIVITMVEKANVTKDTSALLTIESTITDALCIISAIIVLEVISASTVMGAGDIVNMLLGSFLIAAFLGVVAAVGWIAMSHKFGIEKYGYMLTLAIVFIVYAVTQEVKGNGGFAVFVFGLVLGNAPQLAEFLKIKPGGLVIPTLRIFQKEVTFFVRTFFFVYIGLLLTPSEFRSYAVLTALAVTAAALIARKLAQKIMLNEVEQQDKDIIISMMPRGLASAVLASIVMAKGIVIPYFQPIVFGSIVLSNVGATSGVFLFSGEKPIWYQFGKGIIKRCRAIKRHFSKKEENGEGNGGKKGPKTETKPKAKPGKKNGKNNNKAKKADK